MKRKQMTPTVKLVLSIISLVIGLIWTSACVTVLFSMGSLTTLWRGVVLVLFSVLFFWLGIRGLLRWRAEKSRTDPKKVKIILAATGAAMVFIIFQLSLTLPATWASGRINSALRPLVRTEFASENGALPEDPHFVFYNMETGMFSVPSRKSYPKGTDDPEKVNVVVGYTESVRKNGRWVAKGSGQKLSDAYSQGVTLDIIDPKDWSLINEVSFSVRLNYNENGKNVLGMNQVERYLNELFDGES